MRVKMADNSGYLDLKYLVRDTDRHGRTRLYLRRKGRLKVALTAPPGSALFLEQYRQALAGAVSPAAPSTRRSIAGSLRHLCELYYGTAEFKRLDARTRKVRRAILEGLCVDHGDNPVSVLETRHVRALRDEKAELPEAANARVKALRQVFKWAADVGHATTNPARDVPYIRSGSDGFHTWTIEQVLQYERRHKHGTMGRLALDTLLCTGGRRSDAVRLGPQMERANGTELHFTEFKGRGRKAKHREIPILPRLRLSIDATKRETPRSTVAAVTYLATSFGKPFTANGFGNWFKKRCREAGLPDCSAHGLRKAGATIAVENGATEHELMAIYGWETTKQAGVYTRKANRRKLAFGAMHLIVPEQNGDESVQPGNPVGQLRAK